jgi:hypothetical protein
MARSEASILAGILEVQVGGAERSLRVLRITEGRAWKKELGNLIAEISDLDIPSSADDIRKMVGIFANLPSDRMIALVMAYDVDGVLGGPEKFEAEASEDESYRAFRAMLEATFPFIVDVKGAMTQIQTLRQAAQSASASSTSGLLPTGSSTPKPSKKGSRTSN